MLQARSDALRDLPLAMELRWSLLQMGAPQQGEQSPRHFVPEAVVNDQARVNQAYVGRGCRAEREETNQNATSSVHANLSPIS